MPTSCCVIRLIRLCPLVLTLAVGAAAGGEPGPRKRVLIIESFGQPSATAAAISFRTTLEREFEGPVDIYHATLDIARFPQPHHEARLAEFLKSRYQEHRLDLVAAMQAPAVHFVARQRQNLFSGTPIVVTGLDRRRVPHQLHRPTTTYVAGEVDLPGHVENILTLLPGTRHIVMIHGSSAYDQFWAQQNRQELARFADRVQFEWLDAMPFEDVRKRVSKLSKGSVAFLGLLVLDGDGMPMGRDEALERLYAVSKVPLFGYFQSYMGKGVVGGRLYPDLDTGTEAARVAIRILRGESPASIEPSIVSETPAAYDWRELQRFGIEEARLPPGAQVLYRQQTLWEVYLWHITATVALVLLQAALIAGLVLQRARQRRAEVDRKRAEAELNNTRSELAHMSRVFTLGELSSSLAHELNQPLAAILSNAQAAQRFMASDDPAEREEVREILADIVQADKHAGDVIRRMRSMVKKDRLEAEPLDMTRAVDEVLQLLRNDAVLRNINVSLEAEPGLPAVLGDRIQLQQVVLNLLLNAFDAMKDMGSSERTVRLRVGREEHMLKVTVTDVGHGLSDESIERVFDAFYTTKPNGLGMGLSISRSIVEAHHGRLWAESNRTQGATFCFTVPLAPG